MISKTTLSLILCVLGLSTWKYEKTNHAGEKINVDKMREKLNPSPMKEDDNEKINPAVDKTNVDKTKEDLNPSSMKDPLKQNLEEEGLFINFTGFMPLSALDATQCSPFLLLIYMCGADRIAAVSTVFADMFSAEVFKQLAVPSLPAHYVMYIVVIGVLGTVICKWKIMPNVIAAASTLFVRMFLMEGLIELAVSSLPALYVMYEWKAKMDNTTWIIICVACVSAGLVIFVALTVLYMWKKKRDSDESRNGGRSPNPATPKTDDMKQTVTVLDTLKTEMENQMDDVKKQLDEVDEEKKKNKEKLQEVEKKLKETEENYDKREELLKEKQELLQTERRLGDKKRNLEKQQSNLNKLLCIFP